MYSILYNTAVMHCKIPNFRAEIKKAMIDIGICTICYPNENEGRYYLRTIDFQYSCSFNLLKEKIIFVKSAVKSGLQAEQLNANKVIKYSNSEQVLLHIAFEKLHGKQSQSRILSDYRLPFYIYSDLCRLYNASKSLNSKIQSKFGDLDDVVECFNINYFNIFNFIRFLNINSRYMTTPESIKMIDDILHYAHGIPFTEKPDSFYVGLFKIQSKIDYLPTIPEVLLTKRNIISIESLLDYTIFSLELHANINEHSDLPILGHINLSTMTIDHLPSPNESLVSVQSSDVAKAVPLNEHIELQDSITSSAKGILEKLEKVELQLLKDIFFNSVHGVVYLNKVYKYRCSKFKKEDKNKLILAINSLTALGLVKYDEKHSKIKIYNQTIEELSRLFELN